MAAVVAERDGLQTDLASCNEKKAQDALTDTRSEVDTLHQARSAAAEIVAAPAPAGADQASSTDTDGDGVSDDLDLCPGTQQGLTVESTGCAPGTAINLEGVNFLYNSYDLTREAREILDRVANRISQHPDLRLEVAGHTDATGDPSYNQYLSLRRAEAVRDYLVAQGVNPKHIGAAGYGGQRPIADNATIEGLRMNRRVELRPLQ
jgi:OOP family OmpA-OmpF porin